LRDHDDEIRAAGARLVAIGTGDQNYAAAFVRETDAPFLVLVDDDAEAARAAAVRTVGWFSLLHPRTWRASADTWKRGHRVHKAGTRVTQLGATFVVGPGAQVRYEHIDDDSTDHAPVAEVLGALRENEAC
jgi:peroxiredoxin